MLKALRFALVVVATVSSILFATPATAGMIPTPKPASDSAQREAAKEQLKCRLIESGVNPAGEISDKLEQMSTQDLVLLAGHVESTRSAGSVLIAVCVAAAVVVVLLFILFETFYPER